MPCVTAKHHPINNPLATPGKGQAVVSARPASMILLRTAERETACMLLYIPAMSGSSGMISERHDGGGVATDGDTVAPQGFTGVSSATIPSSPATLGDVLYANAGPAISESDWAALVQSVAAGDQLALHALYDRAHRLVFTLAMRITANRETAEELTVDVFHDVWRRASLYDARNGTVLGWIMNQTRSRAIDRLRFEQRKKRVDPGAGVGIAEPEAKYSRDVLEAKEQCSALLVVCHFRHGLSPTIVCRSIL